MGIFDNGFSIELTSPIDEESWKVIADAELDNTEHIYFATPSGKRVDFIKANVLDKLRTEIEQIANEEQEHDKKWAMGLRYAIKVIDKYKKEIEG